MDPKASEAFSAAVVEKLKAIRLEKSLSQERLAAEAHVSRTGITMMENGQRRPTLLFCHAIASALGVSLAEVIRSVEDRSK